jgi:hypothetical protein
MADSFENSNIDVITEPLPTFSRDPIGVPAFDRQVINDNYARLIAGDYTPLENSSADHSNDPKGFKERLTLTLHMSRQLKVNPETIMDDFDIHHDTFFGDDNVHKSYTSLFDMLGIDPVNNQPIEKTREIGKSLARGTVGLTTGGAAGIANLVGLKEDAANIARFNRQFAKDYAAHPRVLDDLMETSGQFRQIGNYAWWLTTAPEHVPNVVLFFGGGATAFTASKLLFKGLAQVESIVQITTATSLIFGESAIESGAAIGEVQAAFHRQDIEAIYKYIEALPEKERNSIAGRALVKAAGEYTNTISVTGDVDLAAAAGHRVFIEDVIVLSLFSGFTFGGAKLAGNFIRKAGTTELSKRAVAEGSAGFALAAIGEIETEVRQSRSTNAAVAEALTGHAVRTDMVGNVFGFVTPEALSGKNAEEFDTALISIFMSARGPAFNLAYRISKAPSTHAAEKEIADYIEENDTPDASAPVKKLVTKLKKDDNLDQQLERIREQGKEDGERAAREFEETRIVSGEEATISAEVEAEDTVIEAEVQEIEAQLEAGGANVLDIKNPVSVEGITAELEKLGDISLPIVVVATVTAVPKEQQSGIPFNAEGFIAPDGKVIIIADRVEKGRIKKVLLHELFHGGLDQQKNKTKLMAQVFEGMSQVEIDKVARLYRLDLATAKSRGTAAEEFLARLSEDDKADPSLLQRVYAAVKQILRDLGFSEAQNFSDNDLRAIIARSLRVTKRGKDAVQERQATQVLQDVREESVQGEGQVSEQGRDQQVQETQIGGIQDASTRTEGEPTQDQTEIQEAKEGQEGEVRLSRAPSTRFFQKHEELRKRRDELLARRKELRKLVGNALTAEAVKRIKRRVVEKTEELNALLVDTTFADEIKRIKKELTDKFKEFLEDTDKLLKAVETFMVAEKIAPEVRARVISSLRVLGKLPTRAAKEKKFDAIISRLASLQQTKEERLLRAKIRKKIKVILKPRKTKKGQQKGPGADLVERIEPIAVLVEMSLPAFEKEQIALKAQVQAAMDLQELNESEMSDLVQQQVLLEAFGHLDGKDIAILTSSLELLENIIANERTLQQELEAARRKKNEGNQDITIDSFGGVPTEVQWLNRNQLPKSSLQRSAEFLFDVKNKTFSMEQKLDKLADSDKTGKMEKLTALWREFFFTANQSEQTANNKTLDALNAAVSEIFGKKPDAVYTQLTQTRVEGVTKALDETGTSRSEELLLNQDQALYLYLLLQMPELSEQLNEIGFDNQTFNALAKVLPEQVQSLGEWMVDNLDKEWFKINPIYRQLFGINMGRLANYFPFRPDRSDLDVREIDPLNTAEMDYGTMFQPGSLIARIKHKLNPKLTNGATALFLQHKFHMNKFQAYALRARDFFAVMKNKDIQRTLRFNLGDKFINEIMDHATQIINGGNKNFARQPGIDILRAAFIYKVLGLNLRLLPTQISSFVAYWINLGTADFFKAIATTGLAAVPGTKARAEFETILNTDFIKNRWRAGSDIEAMFILRQARKKNGFARLAKAGMITTRIGDMIPILVMGRAVYFSAFKEAKSRNLSDAAAKTHAEFTFGSMTEAMQQSSAWKDRTFWQRQGSFGQAAQMFQTSPRQYWSVGVRGMEKFYHGRDRFTQMKAIFTVGVLLPAAFQWSKNFFKYDILSDDDDRDSEDIMREYIAVMLKSPMGGIYLWSIWISDPTIDRLIKGEHYPFSETIPLFELKRDLKAIGDMGYGMLADDGDPEVWENVKKMFPAAKQAAKITERVTE